MAILLLLMIFLVQRATTADFNCLQDTENISATCPTELKCMYEESYQERKGFTKYCRCKIVISYLPLPDNSLTLDAFHKICSQYEENLQQLWIIDAELENIDNNIFAKYKNLRYVSLAGNNMIMNFSTQAERLTHLDLSNNKLNVLAPQLMGNFKSLKMINVSFNRLDKINLCFKDLTVLEEIYLNNNQLTAINRNELEHLEKLRILNLAHNFLDVFNPYSLENLEELHLNNNNLTEIYSVMAFPKLRILRIGGNRITSLGRDFNSQNLEELHWENNTMKQIRYSGLIGLKYLKFLNLSNNELIWLGANTFPPANHIQILDLGSNNLTEVHPENFPNFGNVTFLNLNHNALTEDVITCNNLGKLAYVSVLDLSYNQISKIYDCTFWNLTSLTKLTLSGNRLQEIPPSAFETLEKLRDLDLAHNQITHLVAGVFDNLEQLQKLNISFNHLTKFDINCLKHNKKLIEFDIKHNHLDEIDLNEFRNKFPSLKVIDIDINLIRCDEYSDVLNYFEENSIVLKSCQTATSCCHSTGKIIIISVVCTIVCLLAVVGLFAICCKFCRSSKSYTINLVAMSQKS